MFVLNKCDYLCKGLNIIKGDDLYILEDEGLRLMNLKRFNKDNICTSTIEIIKNGSELIHMFTLNDKIFVLMGSCGFNCILYEVVNSEFKFIWTSTNYNQIFLTQHNDRLYFCSRGRQLITINIDKEINIMNTEYQFEACVIFNNLLYTTDNNFNIYIYDLDLKFISTFNVRSECHPQFKRLIVTATDDNLFIIYHSGIIIIDKQNTIVARIKPHYVLLGPYAIMKHNQLIVIKSALCVIFLDANFNVVNYIDERYGKTFFIWNDMIHVANIHGIYAFRDIYPNELNLLSKPQRKTIKQIHKSAPIIKIHKDISLLIIRSLLYY